MLLSAVEQGTLQQRAERLGQTTFLGGPARDFERVGNLTFQLLLREGLKSSSRVLDVGCGALRVGYWLMRFLEPGCYFGIEPQREVVERALSDLIEADVMERAKAQFAYNDDFDLAVFGESFDFVVARSVWTHASKRQISAMMASFAATSAPGGCLLASYMPASLPAKVGRRWPLSDLVARRLPSGHLPTVLRDYQGDSWCGVDHRRSKGGTASHHMHWIRQEAAAHRLQIRQLPYGVVNRQYWLRARLG